MKVNSTQDFLNSVAEFVLAVQLLLSDLVDLSSLNRFLMSHPTTLWNKAEYLEKWIHFSCWQFWVQNFGNWFKQNFNLTVIKIENFEPWIEKIYACKVYYKIPGDDRIHAHWF